MSEQKKPVTTTEELSRSLEHMRTELARAAEHAGRELSKWVKAVRRP